MRSTNLARVNSPCAIIATDLRRPQGLEEYDIYNPFKWTSARIMISFGTMLFMVAMAYRQLPLDLVPDWVPMIGKMDDLIAGLVAGVIT